MIFKKKNWSIKCNHCPNAANVWIALKLEFQDHPATTSFQGRRRIPAHFAPGDSMVGLTCVIFYHLLPSYAIFYHLLSSSPIFYHRLSLSPVFSHLPKFSPIFYHLLPFSPIFYNLLPSPTILSPLLPSFTISTIFSHLLPSSLTSLIFSHLLQSSTILSHIPYLIFPHLLPFSSISYYLLPSLPSLTLYSTSFSHLLPSFPIFYHLIPPSTIVFRLIPITDCFEVSIIVGRGRSCQISLYIIDAAWSRHSKHYAVDFGCDSVVGGHVCAWDLHWRLF